MLATLICFLPLILLLLAQLVQHVSPPLYARTFGRLDAVLTAGQARLAARVRAGRERVAAYYQAADGYLKFFSKSLVAAVLIFLVLPAIVRIFYPTAGGFDKGTLNTLALGALQYFASVHLALYTYRRLLPGFYAYLVDFIQEKMLDNLTADLEANLSHPELGTAELAVLVEQRNLLQFKFKVRCARLVSCLLPLLFLSVLAQCALTAALTVVPH